MATILDIGAFGTPTVVDGSVGTFWSGGLVGSGNDAIGEASGFTVTVTASPVVTSIPDNAIISAVEVHIIGLASSVAPIVQPSFFQRAVGNLNYDPVMGGGAADLPWGPIEGVGTVEFDGTLLSDVVTKDDLAVLVVGWRLVVSDDGTTTGAISAAITQYFLRVTFDVPDVPEEPAPSPVGIDVGTFTFGDPVAPPAFPAPSPEFPDGEATVIRRSPEITVRDVLNAPPSAQLKSQEIEPQVGNTARVDVGTGLEFEGIVQTVQQNFEEQRDQLSFDVTLSDFAWLLNRRRPFGCFESVSATDIVLSLIADFSSGFTTTAVQAGLPNVSIQFDGSLLFTEALQALTKEIAGQWYLEGKDLHFFTEELFDQPDDLTPSNDLLTRDTPISITTDISQIRTRQFGKGAGGTLAAAISPGQTVIEVLALEDFDPTGQVIVGCQVLNYGAQETRVTAVPRASGPGGLTATPVNSGDTAGVITRNVRYAVSFVKDGVETTLSGSASVSGDVVGFGGSITSVKNIPPPPSLPFGGTFNRQYQFTLETSAGESFRTAGILSVGLIRFEGSDIELKYTVNLGAPDARVTSVKLYRTKIGNTSKFFTVASGLDSEEGVSKTFLDTLEDESLGGRPPVEFASGPNRDFVFSRIIGIQVQLSNIPTGSQGENVTARKIYRSVEGGPFELLTTLGDNVTTTFLDNTSTGQPFDPPTGEDESPGDLPPLIQFFLIGIPSSGLGSITDILSQGTAVNMWVQRDDLDAQQKLSEREGGDGIHEGPIFVDTNLNQAELTRVLDALLVIYSTELKTIRYSTRDPKTRAGRTIHVDLPFIPEDDEGIFDPDVFDEGDPRIQFFDSNIFDLDIFDPGDPNIFFDTLTRFGIFGDFLIQEVTKTQIHAGQEDGTDLAPLLSVSASSSRFTLEDLLQRVLLRN